MKSLTRRDFVSASAGVIAATWLRPGKAAPSKARVGIVGGGFGGVSLARYLRRHDANVSITLIERDSTFVTCPFSNGVIAGLYPLKDVSFQYDQVKASGITVVNREAMHLDPVKKSVGLAGGES
ncbi:MAG TPA: FAD-dependent oxidoreductase, partial [Steroidobacteraceae bacterium]